MSKGNEPAFAAPASDAYCGPQWGLTKRELFAAMMMQGLVSVSVQSFKAGDRARDAVSCADALLAALGKDGGGNG